MPRHQAWSSLHYYSRRYNSPQYFILKALARLQLQQAPIKRLTKPIIFGQKQYQLKSLQISSLPRQPLNQRLQAIQISYRYRFFKLGIVTDLILAVVRLLERDIRELVVEAREALEPVKLQDKGQPSYIILQDQFRTQERRNIETRRTNVLTYRRTQYISQELDYIFKGLQSLPRQFSFLIVIFRI